MNSPGETTPASIRHLRAIALRAPCLAVLRLSEEIEEVVVEPGQASIELEVVQVLADLPDPLPALIGEDRVVAFLAMDFGDEVRVPLEDFRGNGL